MQAHAHDFPRRLAAGSDWFVASAPWNLLVAEHLAKHEPDAVFVLCTRRVEGVCQSLQRSYESGREWAGKDTASRIDLWCDFYKHAENLPADRTVTLDYDALCTQPRETFIALQNALAEKGFPAYGVDTAALAQSHATKDAAQPTIATLSADGSLEWTPRMSWKPEKWTEKDQAALDAHAGYRALTKTPKPAPHRITAAFPRP
jgi:Sulfotransferase family